MKKILFLLVCCLCLVGCVNDSENSDLLVGEWSYLNTEIGETKYAYFLFNNDKTFTYYICFHHSQDDYCANGEAEFSGTYTLKNSTLKLNVKEEKQVIDRYGFKIVKPSLSYIIDFDNMYFCDRNEGLDCTERYEKDA